MVEITQSWFKIKNILENDKPNLFYQTDFEQKAQTNNELLIKIDYENLLMLKNDIDQSERTFLEEITMVTSSLTKLGRIKLMVRFKKDKWEIMLSFLIVLQL